MLGLWSLLHVLFLAQHQTRGISIKAVFRSYLSELSIRATKKTVSIRTVSSPVWVGSSWPVWVGSSWPLWPVGREVGAPMPAGGRRQSVCGGRVVKGSRRDNLPACDPPAAHLGWGQGSRGEIWGREGVRGVGGEWMGGIVGERVEGGLWE